MFRNFDEDMLLQHFIVTFHLFILVICFSTNKVLLSYIDLFLTIHLELVEINFLLPSLIENRKKIKKFFACRQDLVLIFIISLNFLSLTQYPKRMFSLMSQFNDCKLITRVPSSFWVRSRIASMMTLYLSFLINLEVVYHVSYC